MMNLAKKKKGEKSLKTSRKVKEKKIIKMI